MKRLLNFAEKNPQTILLLIAAGGAYYLYSTAKGTVSNLIDLTGQKLSTLGQGLSNPIDALSALVKPPTFVSQTAPTANFQRYIDLNGGMDKYIREHKNGTWSAPPYNATTAYPKTSNSNPLDIFSNW